MIFDDSIAAMINRAGRSLMMEAAMALDVTKPVKTRDGRKVRILCADAGGTHSVAGIIEPDERRNMGIVRWNHLGEFINREADHCDLVHAPPDPVIRYVNIWREHDGRYVAGIMWESEKDAKENAKDEGGKPVWSLVTTLCVQFTPP